MRLQKYKKKTITSNIYSSFALLFYLNMKIFKTQTELKQYLEAEYSKPIVGFVPTMGALHDGHLSLIKASGKDCDVTVCSIFVNPTQFNNSEDFEKYPIDHSSDIEALNSVGCDVLFLPTDANEVYKSETEFNVDLGEIGFVLEGEHRPGHFKGVMRVVKLLFEIVNPDKAYFGLKDYQQYLVIQKMVKELAMDVEVIGCDIIRESSGLAMSSRNKRLSEVELNQALVLQKALLFCQENYGDIENKALEEECLEILSKGSSPEYFKICDAVSLQEIRENTLSDNVRAFVAAQVGEVRLIDNVKIC